MATYKIAILLLSAIISFPVGTLWAQPSQKTAIPKVYKHHYYFIEEGDTLQTIMNENFKWSKNNKKNRVFVKWVKNWNIAVKDWKELPEGKRLYFKLPFWKGEKLPRTMQSFNLKERERIPVDRIIPGLKEWEEKERLQRLMKFGKGAGAGGAGAMGAGALAGDGKAVKNKQIVSSNIKDGQNGQGSGGENLDDFDKELQEARGDQGGKGSGESKKEEPKKKGLIKSSEPHKWMGLNWKFAITYTLLQNIMNDKTTTETISSTQVSWLGAGLNVKVWNQVPDPEFVFVIGGNVSNLSQQGSLEYPWATYAYMLFAFPNLITSYLTPTIDFNYETFSNATQVGGKNKVQENSGNWVNLALGYRRPMFNHDSVFRGVFGITLGDLSANIQGGDSVASYTGTQIGSSWTFYWSSSTWVRLFFKHTVLTNSSGTSQLTKDLFGLTIGEEF